MAKRKRNGDVPPPVEVDLKWVADDDGTVLRWAEITDYDACNDAPHEPRIYIIRLDDNAAPRGKRLHNMANWGAWRKAIRSLPFHEAAEFSVYGEEGADTGEGVTETDILVACAIAARDTLAEALKAAGGTLGERARGHITNVIDAADALTGKKGVPHEG